MFIYLFREMEREDLSGGRGRERERRGRSGDRAFNLTRLLVLQAIKDSYKVNTNGVLYSV